MLLRREAEGKMRIQAYLRVLSTEATIRALHSEAKVPHASIKETKARKVDDGLRALLLAYKPIFPIIKKHQGPETDIYLELVTHYERGEEPLGVYLSAETVLLLSEMGGAFDNDVHSGN